MTAEDAKKQAKAGKSGTAPAPEQTVQFTPEEMAAAATQAAEMEKKQDTQAGLQGQAGVVADGVAFEKSAKQLKWEAGENARRESWVLYTSLPAKHSKTVLGLAVLYVHHSMGQETVLSPEELTAIEVCQDGINLMAAATLCSTGRY